MTFVSRRYSRPRSERQRQTTLRYNSRLHPSWNAVVTSATAGVAVEGDLVLTFDRPVILRSNPALTRIRTNLAANETGSTQTGPNEVTVHFDANIGTATTVLFPNPPSNKIRTVDGGWTQSGVFPVDNGEL